MTLAESILIQGCKHTDGGGTLLFFNDFNVAPIKRFYVIEHPNTNIIRAWQWHKIKQKWFYVVAGSFKRVILHRITWDNSLPDLTKPEYKDLPVAITGSIVNV
jgi:dTDP-4-dehydrorhamnose 3,5-epimerase